MNLAAASRPPYLALRHRDYRRLLVSQLLSLIGSQMQVVAINWHVYLLTRSPLALGFVGLTRVLPIIIFSLWAGVVADRRDRRRVMIASQLAMTAVALALAGFTFAHGETLWLLYGLNLLSAAAVAFDGPARQALIPRLVPAEDLPGALSLDLSVFQAALIGGPALAGLIIAGHADPLPRFAAAGPPGHAPGLALIYALNAVSFLAVIFALATMRTSGAPEAGAGEERPWKALQEGLRFVFTTPLMVWTMGLDFFATFFSGAMSLLPIFADQILKVGAKGYGILVAAPAMGALAGSLFASIRPLPPRQGRIFLVSVAAYGAATVVFGFSRSFPLTMAALAATGLADAISTVIRRAIRQLATPDRLRGRMTSVNMIFFMGGPQLGELEAGLVASLFASTAVGVTVSVVSGGVATLLVAAVIAAVATSVRQYDLREHTQVSPVFPVGQRAPGRADIPMGP
ncbi:MAG TPA: MFS transporter [Thermoanaerobaculia bacterium]|nr:MFS transporter [Thermoanaerobaculia bacterium]